MFLAGNFITRPIRYIDHVNNFTHQRFPADIYSEIIHAIVFSRGYRVWFCVNTSLFRNRIALSEHLNTTLVRATFNRADFECFFSVYDRIIDLSSTNSWRTGALDTVQPVAFARSVRARASSVISSTREKKKKKKN